MKHIDKTRKSFTCSFIIFVFALLFLTVDVIAESYTFKAPETYYSIKLKQDERYYDPYDDPFRNLSITLDGWVCGKTFTDTTINKIKEINRLIQPLAEAKDSLGNLEKVMVQMGKEKVITLSKSNVQNAVYTAIANAIKKTGFSSEVSLVNRAESLSRDTLEEGKDISRLFGDYGDRDLYKNVYYGEPRGIWNLSKMEPDEPSSVVYVAQDCYQKQDIEAMANAIVSAARKLDEVLKSYKETRDRVLALGK